MDFKVEDGSAFADSTSFQSVSEFEAYWASRGGFPSGLDDLKSTGTLRIYFQPSDGDMVTIAGNAYTFRSVIDDAVQGEVLIGSDVSETTTNIAGAVNGVGSPGTDYSVVTRPHLTASMGAFQNGVSIVTAIYAGLDGDSISTTSTFTDPNNGWDSVTLSGFEEAAETRLNLGTAYLNLFAYAGTKATDDQANQFPRFNCFDSVDGFMVDSNEIPVKLKSALSEVSVASDPNAMLVNITPGQTSGVVIEKTEKLDGFQETTKYDASGAGVSSLQETFTTAQALLSGLLASGDSISIGIPGS